MSGSAEFSELELDGLREIMNIAFGQAAANLSEVIDMNVILSVPKVSLVPTEGVGTLVRAEILSPALFSMVEQFFFGNISGTSCLLLPEQEGRKLVDLFGDPADPELRNLSLDALERETIIEVGNIIIGACVGKVAEILGDVVTFHPPQFVAGPIDENFLDPKVFRKDCLALVFKTLFKFERQEITGLLFLITTDVAIVWLRRAIGEFLERIG